MTAYIHANVLAEYAKDAATNDKPWEGWEWRTSNAMGYFHCGITHTPGAYADHQYRRIKKTKTVMCRAYVYRGLNAPEAVSLLQSNPNNTRGDKEKMEGISDFIRWEGDWFPVEVEA